MAKIDVSKIDKYADMTADELREFIGNFTYDDGSVEIEKYKNAISKSNSDAAGWKKKYNEMLSEEDKKKQESAEELNALKEKLAILENEKTVSEYSAKFLSLGYSEDLAKKTAKAMADGDMSTVFANQQKFKDEYKKKVEEEVLKKTPRPDTVSQGEDVLDKKKFEEMGYQERARLFQENPDLYNQLNE